ncbi:GMC family oxidoreductase [Ancylobacter sp. 6x-1]|uniref:GMC family oxidoreductase n=2 Tax=Ancylobacter crimeensis TaxID=2579147 RepID=A0ABT0D6H8_9HYPH|nr:GMC family oxidoreductase [Ancylobacter crimeensis]
MAVDLARRGRRVALLEAGPAKPEQNSQKWFEQATLSGKNLEGLHVGRFRCLGGTTNFWGGQLVPFAPMVFAQRNWVSDALWPINSNDIAPFVDAGFNILGLGHVIRDDTEVWKRLRLQAPPKTDTIQPIVTRWAPESNLAIHFAKDIAENPNLTVVLNAQVGAIIVGDNGAVEGVQIRFTDSAPIHVRGESVVLANGTIEISRLLQLPDHLDRQTPWATNQWLGRAFMDHIDCYAGGVVPIDNKRFSDLFDNAFIEGLKYNPKLRLADEVQAREQLLEISSHFVYRSSIADNIANLKILVRGLLKGRVKRSALSDPLAMLGTLKFVVPMAIRYIRYRRMMNLSDAGIQLRLTSEQTPVTESRVRLREERDPFGMPIVDVDWKLDPRDFETMARFAEYIKYYLESHRLARVDLAEGLVKRDPDFFAQADDANHQMGGARMATSAQEGVVDADCAVFGTRNLYVAGAAVYPTSGFANPTFTAIALGLRLASHLISRRKELYAKVA